MDRANKRAVSPEGSSHCFTIAEYLTDTFVSPGGQSIPDAALDSATWCFVDTLGVALAAAGLDVGTAATRVALKSSSGPCAVWGSGHTVSVVDAVLANGMLSHALDFDDTHAAAIMHTSCMVVPTALAVGQELGATGQAVLEAAVIGYEVAGRLGRLAPGDFQTHGFQATSVLGVFACVATAARLMGLNREQVVNAFGIAGSTASGLMEYLANGSVVKQLHAGWSAQAGIRTVQLALEGFTGPATVFEGRFGVFNSFARKTIDPVGAVCSDVTSWEVQLMGAKPYPACLCVHPLVQAVLEIKQQLVSAGGSLNDILHLRCHVPAWYVNLVFEPTCSKAVPSTPYEARFSGPYCIARMLLDGELAVTSFTEAKISDRAAADLARRVSYEVEALPEFPEAFPARVVATLTTGSTLEAYVHRNLGSPGNPMSRVQYKDKFLRATEPFMASAQARELLCAIKRLVQPNGMQELSATLDRLTLTNARSGIANRSG